jgi:hypothetical protein
MPLTWAEPGRRGSRGTLPLKRSTRIGPVRRASRDEHRRARSPPAQSSSSLDITSVPARTWSATRTSEARIGRDWPSTRKPERIRAGHATAPEERKLDRQSDRSRSRPRDGRLSPAGAPPAPVERSARLAIDRASREARLAASKCGWKGAAVAADRYGSRRRRRVGRGFSRGSPCRWTPPLPDLGDGGGRDVRGTSSCWPWPPNQTLAPMPSGVK